MLQLRCLYKTKEEEKMLRKVEQFIDQWEMLSENDVVIVGVSGGADSVALLLILDELRKNQKFSIHVVHVNHGIRGADAAHDESYVQQLCEARGISFSCVRVDVPVYAKEQKISEEEAGREVRRNAFQKAMKDYNGTKIALAHHQEDNAETFFLNLARGSKLKGLGGIYPVKGEYIRPLLCVGRKEIETFLEERNVKYCMDATNLEDTYMRNRIRNHVLPYFRDHINDKTVEHVNAAMEYLREVQGYLEEQQQIAYEAIVSKEKNAIVLKKEPFGKTPEIIRKMVIRCALAEMAGREKDLEETHIHAVAQLMQKQTGRGLDLPYGLTAKRSYEGIVIGRKTKVPEAENILEITLKDGACWKYEDKTISCRIFEKPEGEVFVPKKTFTKWFDYDIIKGNVSVRTRRPGDKIVIDADHHSKKLKSFYIDEKIPSEKRDHIPVLAIDKDILWVIGYRQSKNYQVTKETKTIVEIVVNGGK